MRKRRHNNIVMDRNGPSFQRFAKAANFSGIYRIWHGDVLLKVGLAESQTIASRLEEHLAAGRSGLRGNPKPKHKAWRIFMAELHGRPCSIEFYPAALGECYWAETTDFWETGRENIVWEVLLRECPRVPPAIHGCYLDDYLEARGARYQAAWRRRVVRILDGEETL
jgi:hypothetical protein